MSNLLEVGIVVRLKEHNGAESFEVEVAWFFAKFYVNPLLPAFHKVPCFVRYFSHSSVDLDQRWYFRICFP